MSKRKYRELRQIESMTDFDEVMDCGYKWFIWRGKTVHISFLISLQYRVLMNAIKEGVVYLATKIEDED